jgi:hypothetical protein
MSNLRRHRVSGNTTPDPERLPLRWAVIGIAAAGVGAVAFLAGGPLAALGAVGATVSTLHTVME